MPSGSTASPMRLGPRRRRAFELYTMGFSPQEVADELGVSQNTAYRYRDQYEEQLQEQARNNPDLLRNFLENTVRMLEENELVRSRAWAEYESPTTSGPIRARMLEIALKAQKERAALFGVLGVKAEFFAHVQQVRLFQERLIEHLLSTLCQADRDRLVAWLQGEQQPSQLPALPAAELDLVEVSST